MIGVAVGLGNVWRFPYMMGSYGGSAFLLIYFVFTLFFAFPALLTEISLGQKIRKGVVYAFKSLFGNKTGSAIGYFFIGVITISGSYYAVVVANVFFSAGFSIISGFSSSTKDQFQLLLGNGMLQYGITIALVITALFVSYLGIKRGIERISMIIMPFFLLSILYMIGYAWFLPGALTAVKQFLTPDFTAFGSAEIFAALGQAFFSIGLGGTFVIVYAGFLPKNENIPRIAIFTSLGDLGSSILVSLFLIPCIIVFGLEMNAGPSLIFNTLPELFTVLPAGRWIGSVFLVSLSLVAFLSLIAAFQVVIVSLGQGDISQKKLIISFGILQIFLTMPSALYPQIIGSLDLIFGSGMQVLGSMLVIGGVWWGRNHLDYQNLLFKNSKSMLAIFAVFWLRWVIPGTLLLVLLGYIYTSLT